MGNENETVAHGTRLSYELSLFFRNYLDGQPVPAKNVAEHYGNDGVKN